MRGRQHGGANNKGASFPPYRGWYSVRGQRGGCWATKFSCFRCGLSRLESEAATGGFPQPTGKGGGKGKGVFWESQYPGRSGGGDGAPRNVPPTTRRVPNPGARWRDRRFRSISLLGCSLVWVARRLCWRRYRRLSRPRRSLEWCPLLSIRCLS